MKTKEQQKAELCDKFFSELKRLDSNEDIIALMAICWTKYDDIENQINIVL